MKFILVTGLFLSSFAFAKDVKNFNKTLLENVKTDIQNQNDQDLKTKPHRARGPASVEVEKTFPEESLLEKKERQLGSKKW